MESPRAAWERRWRIRYRLALFSVALPLMALLAVIQPMPGAVHVVLVGTLAAVLGFVVGAGTGRRQRRFLPLRGSGPRISQSIRARPAPVYVSYDVTEEPFELTEDAVATVGLNALSTAPFARRSASAEIGQTPEFDERFQVWLFHTHDSAGRPIFLDESGILAMLAFTKPGIDSDVLQRALQQVVDGGASTAR